MAFTVGELSKLTGVTVRALHHYDEIGLVQPSARTVAGYRLYGDADVRRLEQVLVLRELGLPLAEIASMVRDPRNDGCRSLRAHRDALVQRRERLDAMIAALDRLVKGKDEMTDELRPEDVKAAFAGFDHREHEAEAQEKWGGTAEYAESARRTQRYGKAEWDEIARDSEAIYARIAARMRAGATPTDADVQSAVEEHRLHIDRWFYRCAKEMHRNLGEMYAADPRFAANFEKIAPGLAQFLRDAIAAS